jgi:hypothetical protein
VKIKYFFLSAQSFIKIDADDTELIEKLRALRDLSCKVYAQVLRMHRDSLREYTSLHTDENGNTYACNSAMNTQSVTPADLNDDLLTKLENVSDCNTINEIDYEYKEV